MARALELTGELTRRGGGEDPLEPKLHGGSGPGLAEPEEQGVQTAGGSKRDHR